MPRFGAFLSLLSCCGVLAGPATAGTAPADFSLLGHSGGVEPWDVNHTIDLAADGTGRYVRHYPEDDGLPPEATADFTLTPQEVEQLWDEIVAQDFFNLAVFTSNPDVVGGAYLEITVVANADTHTVGVQNTMLPELDALRLLLNALTPPDADLVYHGPTALPRLGGGLPAHPGSVAAYCWSLQKAVANGRAIVTSKGGALGSVVEIDINNDPSVEKPTIKVQVYLEFYGDATQERVDAIEAAIEAKWNGLMTSGGKTIEMCVTTRFTSGPDAPNTPGFHQIKLADVETSYVDDVATLNMGVETGCWRYMGRFLPEMYAHECGHLLGFDDQYEDWLRREDGSWQQRGGVGPVLTSDELAAHADPLMENLTEAQLQTILNDPDKKRFCPPKAGHAHDLMADKTQPITQENIDALAANPGFKVKVRPGDVFLNENEAEQDLVATRSIDIFVPSGGMRTFSDVYAACLDAGKPAPGAGTALDVAPSVSSWNGITLSGQFQALLNLINVRELWATIAAQKAIAWFTDQLIPLDQEALDLLEEIGIDTSQPPTVNIPKLTDPVSNPNQTNVEVPTELVGANIIPFDFPMAYGDPVDLTGEAQTPDGTTPNVTGVEWNVATAPDGSTADVDDPFQPITNFYPDQPGLYEINIGLDVSAVQTGARVGYPVHVTRTTRIFAADSTMETFEAGVLAASGFPWVHTGDVDWAVRPGTPHTGSFSLSAEGVGDGQTATIEVEVELDDSGPIAFARKVSSELNDKLSFYVNDVLLSQAAGESDWTYVTIPLFPGTFTLKWEYAKDGSGSGGADQAWIDDLQLGVIGIPVDTPHTEPQPPVVQLRQNAPNPFRRFTTIRFEVAQPGTVQLSLYDVSGRLVSRIVDAALPAGLHEVRLNGQDLAPGTYFYRVRAPDGDASRRLIVLD